MAHSRNSKTRIKAARRGIEALQLRETGLTYKEIGERMGVSEPRAWQIVSKEFDRINQRRAEKAEAVVRLELQRLDAIHKTLWEKCKQGDLKAISTLLKTMERRAALLGLDIKRHEVKVEESYEHNVTARIVEYAADLDRQLGARSRALPGRPQGDDCREPLDQAGSDVQAEPVPGV